VSTKQEHPENQRPHAPEAPMSLHGDVLPGDPHLMVRCMLEELFQLGRSYERLREMTTHPHYQALYAARQVLGDEAMDAAIEEVYRRVGRHRHTTRSAPTDSSGERRFP